MKIGLKFRIYPDKQQKQLIHQTAGNNRFIYNHFLDLKNTWWQDNKDLAKEKRTKSLSGIDCINLLPQLKKEIFSISSDKIKDFEQRNGKPIDWMTINATDFESLKSYWLNDGLSTALQQKLRHLDNAFQDFFKAKKGYPAVKKKSSADSFTLTPNNWRFYFKNELNINDKNIKELKSGEIKTNKHAENFHTVPTKKELKKLQEKEKIHLLTKDLTLNFSNTLFQLSCTDKPLKIEFDKEYLKQNIDVTKISQVTVSYNAAGQYFISFLVDEELTQLKAKNFIQDKNSYLKHCDEQGNHQKITISIDMGIKNSLTLLKSKNSAPTQDKTLSTKKLIGLKRHEKRLRRLQKSLSRKVKNSKNFNKQKIKVAKEYNNLVNYRTDFYHKASTELVLNSDRIIMENLNIKGMMKNKRLAKSIGHQSWGQFMTMVKYKCEWYNKELTILDRFFPSSKLCSHCHVYNAHVKQEDSWQCFHCLAKHQRDENAVKNMQDYSCYRKVGKIYVHESYQDIKEYEQLINNNPQLNKLNKGKNKIKKQKIGENQANLIKNKNKDDLSLNNQYVLPRRQDQAVQKGLSKPVETL